MYSLRTIVSVSAAVIFATMLLCTCGRDKDVSSQISQLEARIDSLRTTGQFREALASASELLDLRHRDEESKPYQITDAERLVSTLELTLILPAADQEDLARAYEMRKTSEKLVDDARYDEAEASIEEQLDTFTRLLGPGHLESAACFENLAIVLSRKGKFEAADSLFHETLTIRRNSLDPDHPLVGKSLNNIGSLLLDRGDPDGAERNYADALETYRETLGAEHSEVGKTLYNLAKVFYRRGDDEGAERLYLEALDILKKALGPEDPHVALTLNNLGKILYERRDLDGAEPIYREALAIGRKTLPPNHPELATSMNNLANVVSDNGDYEAAEPLYRDALKIRREAFGPDHPQVGMSLSNLAQLLSDTGDYAGAEVLFREALAIFRKALPPDSPNLIGLLNNIGILLSRKGDYAAADPVFREALEIGRKVVGPDDPRLGSLVGNMALLSVKRENYAEAESFYQEALRINRKANGPDHPSVARCLHNLADLHSEKGDHEKAESLSREALEIRLASLPPDHPDLARNLNNLGILLARKGEYAEAESLYTEALEIKRKVLGADHPDVVAGLNNLGSLLFRMGDYAAAEQHFSESAELYETSRLRLGEGIERAAFQRSPYRALAPARLEAGQTEDAWPAAERSLGRVLADLLLASDSRPLSDSERASQDSLRKALTKLESRVEGLEEADPGELTPEETSEKERARAQLAALQAEWSSFQARLRREYPVTEGQPYPLERIQAALDDDSAIIGWLDVEGEEGAPMGSWAYVILKEGPVVWARVGSSQEETATSAREHSERFREELVSPMRASSGLKATVTSGLEKWRRRVAPVSDALDGVEDLVVITSGAMLGVPAEALVDDSGAYLGDRFSVSYTPSATIYAWLKEREKARVGEPERESLLVGDPPFRPDQMAAMEQGEDLLALCLAPRERRVDHSVLRGVLAGNREARENLERLPCTRLEIQGIAPLLQQPTILVGPQATEQELVRLAQAEELRGFSTIHLATHVLVDDESPERSALVLSQVGLPDPVEAAIAGQRIYDGLITAKDILRGWKLNAHLVTLSGCESALGKEIGGEGYVGLAHAFLQAGARSLIVSLWPVEDRSTSLLMERFYENWTGRYEDVRNGRTGEPMSKADALQEAKRYVRSYAEEDGERPFEHPFFWAPFILIGERE